MAIISVTPTIGISIMDKGTLGWGTVTNNNLQLIDNAFSVDRSRLTSLETTSAVLPVAIANRVGHNLIRNNIFQLPDPTDPARAIQWAPVFANGAAGYTTRDSSTWHVGISGPAATSGSGRFSQRVSVVTVNLGGQIRPFPGMVMTELDSSGNPTNLLSSNDSRQLLNSFGYVYQALQLAASTRYTLSSYGKSEIPNNVLGINVRWKVGVVFRDTSSNIIRSHFTLPQTNYTSDLETDSFQRAALTFVTPDLPVIQAEVWLVCEGVTPAGIGSSFFDGVQLEQAAQATFLETFAMRNGSMFIDGDITIGGSLNLQQDQLVLATNKVVLSGDVQIGSDITKNVLDVFTKIATFYGPVDIRGNVTMGSDPAINTVRVSALTTTFFSNQDPVTPIGGNVVVQGNLEVNGSTILGSDSTSDTVVINATLLSAIQSAHVGADMTIDGSITVKRSSHFGTNKPLDSFLVQMDEAFGSLGSDFHGNVRLWNNLSVTGNTTLGSGPANTLTINAGSTSLTGALTVAAGLTVGGTTLFNIGTGLSDTFTVVANTATFNTVGTTTWNASDFNLSGSMVVGNGSPFQYFQAEVASLVLGYPLTASTNTLAVNANISAFTGAATFGGAVTIGTNNAGNLTIAGASALFGTAVSHSILGLIPRPFVSFQSVPVANNLNQPAHGGTIVLGDPQSLQSMSGRLVYATTVTVNAGTTYFGNPSPSGSESVGDVQIGGNLTVGGATALGNSTTADTLTITAQAVNIAVGTGSVNIGGGYLASATYNPLDTDHGGTTIDANGNVSLNGKLTVKGPIDPISLTINTLTSTVNAIEVNDQPDGSGSMTFALTRAGTINAFGDLKLGDPLSVNGYRAQLTSFTTTFGQALSPQTTFSVYSANANFSANANVAGVLTANQLAVTTSTSMTGSLTLGGGLTVAGAISAPGTVFSFGNAPSSSTIFTVLANTIQLGPTGLGIANVAVDGNLTVTKNVTIGSTLNSVINVSADNINIATASNRLIIGPIFIEQKGFRVGGGYQNNVYNSGALDHGGVTIDAYGNIFADGTIAANGPLAFNSLTLNAPVGSLIGDQIFTVNNLVTSEEVFHMDNLGNFTSDGYITLRDTHVHTTPLMPNSQTLPTGDAYAMFRVINTNLAATVFEIDNLGNVVMNGSLAVNNIGASSLATYSATVGDGLNSFGDYNLNGPHNQSANPIGAAITHLTATGGTIFIKKGSYPIPVGGYSLQTNVSLVGEGRNVVTLDGTTNSPAIGVTCATGSAISNVLVKNCTTGILSTVSQTTLRDIIVTGCSTGISLSGTLARVEACSLTGVSAGTGINIQSTSLLTEILDCHIQSFTTAITASAADAKIMGNYLATGSTGVNVTGATNIITANTISAFTTTSVQVGGANCAITKNTLTGTGAGTAITFASVTGVVCEGNIATNWANGFSITGCTNLRLATNRIVGIGSGTALTSTTSSGGIIANNHFESFADGLTSASAQTKIIANTFTSGSTNGIVLQAGALDAIVADNYLSGFGTLGISVADVRNIVTNNSVAGTGAGTGMTVSASSAVVANNNFQNYAIGLSLSGSKAKATSNTFGASAASTNGVQCLSGSDGAMLIGNQFDDFDARGATVASGVIDCKITGNKFANSTGPIAIAIELVGGNTATVISENIIRNADQGIVLTGSLNRVIGNTVVGNGTANTGIAIGGTDQLVSGNYVQSFTSAAISLSATTSQVLGNNLLNGATCINVLLGQNVVANNNLRSYTTTGISVPTGVTGCIVEGNRVTGGGTAVTGINVVGNENAINSNYVVDHTTNGVVISGSDCTAIGNITLRNP